MPKTDRKASDRLPGWKTAAAALSMALLAVAIAYPGLISGREIPISSERFGLSDLTDQNLPLRVWGGAELARGRLPLWYPGCLGGLPLASIPEAVPYYPPSALFYTIASPGAATAWTIVLHLLIAGVGGAMVARQFGAGLGGQLLAAVLMSIGLHVPGHVRQLNIMQAQAWTPWAWLFLDRLLIRPGRRDVAGLGFSMGMLGLAGHPEILHHAAVIFSVWAIIRIAGLFGQWRDWRFWGRRALAIAAAALIAGAVALPTLGPICEMMQWVHRSHARHAPDLEALGMLLRPMMLGDPATGDVGPNPFFGPCIWEEMFYLGLLPIALAAAWIVLPLSRRRLRVGLLAIGGASLFLAFAEGSTLYWITDMIPMELTSRFTHRYLWGVNMALAMLAAFGLDGLLRVSTRVRWFTPRAASVCVSIVLLVTALDIAWVTRRLNPMGDSSPLVSRPDSLDVIDRAGAAPDRFAERLSTYASLPVAIAAFDLRPGWSPNPAIDLEIHRFWLTEHPSIWNWQAVRGYVGMNPAWTGMMIGDQHTAGILTNLDSREDAPIASLTPRPERYIAWSGFFGGRWMVSPIELVSPLLRPLGDIPGKYFHAYIYENKTWAGGAWIAHSLKTFRSDDWLCVDLQKSMPDRNCIRMSVADVPPGVESGSFPAAENDSAGIPEWPDPQHVNVDCRLERPGFLVLNQSYHPGWRVRIDGGAPQKTLRVNMGQAGVWLNAGRHRVNFEYPGRLERICLLTGLAGFVTAIFLFFYRKMA